MPTVLDILFDILLIWAFHCKVSDIVSPRKLNSLHCLIDMLLIYKTGISFGFSFL